jgi:hypothetical protein
MLGPGGNRSDYHEWEHSPPPDAPFAHRIRPFRPPTGPATHTSSVNSPSSDRGEEERGGDRSASGSVERSHVCKLCNRNDHIFSFIFIF